MVIQVLAKTLCSLCVAVFVSRFLPRPFSLIWPYVYLRLKAPLSRSARALDDEEPTLAGLQRLPSVFEAVENGEPIELGGVRIRRPAVAFGKVVARKVERRIVPGTEQYSGHWFGLEFLNTVWLAYGYRTRKGRRRFFVEPGREFRSTEWNTPRYGGAVGQTVLIVYDLKGRRQVVFSLAGGAGAGPARTAFRKSG